MSSPSRPDTEGNKSTIRAYCAAIDAAQNTDALNELASVAYDGLEQSNAKRSFKSSRPTSQID